MPSKSKKTTKSSKAVEHCPSPQTSTRFWDGSKFRRGSKVLGAIVIPLILLFLYFLFTTRLIEWAKDLTPRGEATFVLGLAGLVFLWYLS